MTWLLFACLALLAFASADLLGKKKVDSGDSAAPLKMLLSVMIFAFFVSLSLFAFGLGESGLAPWRILMEYPLIAVNLFCFLMYWLLYLMSFRYIGLTWEAAVSGTSSILYFIGLVLIHFLSGKLVSVGEILSPLRLIPVLLVLFFTALLPNVEFIAVPKSGAVLEKVQKDRHKTVIGLLILLQALTFDAADSLITTVMFDEGSVGVIDYLTASYFATILPIILLWLFLWKQTGKRYLPFKDGGKYSILYPCLAVLTPVLYLYASSLDAVRTGIVFITAPIFSIIGARIFLKEKYTWRQNLCVWIITLAAIVFCAVDYIL